MDERLERAPIGVLEVGNDGTVRDVNDVARGFLDVDDAAAGASLETIFPRSVEDSLFGAFEGPSVTAREFEEYYPDCDLWLAVSIVPSDSESTVYLRDVTKRRRQERTIERLHDEQERTAVIDELISDILAALVGATSREEITETIGTALGETALFEFAWVGEHEVGGDDLVVQAVAGDTGEMFTAVQETIQSNTATPEERAVETGQLQVRQPLADDPEAPDRIRRAGFADGIQSSVAIPLVYGSNVHGVVGVYASGEDAFSDRECTSFETLGEIAGFAVMAARNRNLLLSNTVTELVSDIGRESVLASLSDELDAELELEGLVPRSDDALLCYVSAMDADLERIDDVTAGRDDIGDARIVDDGDTGGVVELEVRGSSALFVISAHGGTIQSARFDRGTGRIVAELPPGGDVRRVAQGLSREADADIVAKRERESSVTTARELRNELADRLTDRQETVLRTAYLAEYFESPRASTAEEVANSLDITGSTLLYHLRAAQRKLLDAFFEERPD